ncbi:uncharacterized protein LOC108903178 [Anoplophora glabripennis]|uniref:uncharacterized protein LOC108903178 n=1 Tax=Anoplophora glabripennis TaxID=217634 RepID=UPI000C7827CC|nr:uncharacterized protein LOC108903178 [Anoplophora glabripennis]
MKIFCLILGCLFYSVQSQLDFSRRGIKTVRNVTSPVQGLPGVANLEQLEKVFLQDWLDFGTKFNKKYSPNETSYRMANFIQNTHTIIKLTSDGVLNFGLKMNEFGDMLFDEFNKVLNGFNRNGQLRRLSLSSKAGTFLPEPGESIPESVDWREKGAVSPVKNQHQCQACWAFSVAGCVEGQIARKTGKLEEVSIQHLIDCATGRYGNEGCRGGFTEAGFDFVQDNGVNSYSEYPYEAVDDACRPKNNTIIKTQSYIRIPKGDEEALAQALAKFGPISTAIHVTENFQFYGDKIFDDPKCGNTPDDLNHAVLIVGYGQEADGRKFWLVKNSYGTTWGLDGYFKVAKDEGNKCGIATYASFPRVFPEQFDWRDKGLVTKVKDQLSCDGSFYFAALDVIASHHYLKTGETLDLSEQYVLDCSLGFNNGCNGGGLLNSIDFVRMRGVVLEEDYPYSGTAGTCKINSSHSLFRTIGYVILARDEEVIKTVVGTIGPVGVTFKGQSLDSYSGGIYNDPDCQLGQSYSGVIVGYGTSDEGEDYWTVKMSYGASWGEEGFMRLEFTAMRIFIVFICTILVVKGTSIEEQWQSFKDNVGKHYRSRLEESTRFQIFKDNVYKIEEHNRRFARGEVSYKLAVNKFADLTEEEFKARLNPRPAVEIAHPTPVFGNFDDTDVPDELDWRDKGAVTGVKDQGNCGGCWAFGATGVLEGQYFLKTGKLESFSEQFLIDCSMMNNGCSGGWTLNAYRSVRDIGMVTDKSYPYEAADKACRANGTFFKDIGIVTIPQDENAIKAAVAKIGPVSVSIDASYLYLYGGGVFDNDRCSTTFTNHVVLIVGYGTTSDGIDYWEVKNSWGADWGVEGYVKMSRNKNSQCAIASGADYVVI